jgi:hypothetical protein
MRLITGYLMLIAAFLMGSDFAVAAPVTLTAKPDGRPDYWCDETVDSTGSCRVEVHYKNEVPPFATWWEGTSEDECDRQSTLCNDHYKKLGENAFIEGQVAAAVPVPLASPVASATFPADQCYASGVVSLPFEASNEDGSPLDGVAIVVRTQPGSDHGEVAISNALCPRHPQLLGRRQLCGRCR